MKFLSLFSGCGGMDYGLMQAGHECVGFVELDKYAYRAFEILHDPEGRLWNAYDVRSVSDDDLRLVGDERGPIQLIVGGFPCQSFSVAGKREGFKDTTRGTLFFEIVRFASVLRPQCLLLENVTGLLNHDEGRTFEAVIGTLDELGYDAEWQVLNSKDFGVPQNRERIFIVGHLRGASRREVFPIGGENENAIEVVGRLEGNHDQNSRVYGVGGGTYSLHNARRRSGT
jgi:DNA (cytosine-5)-methyltransferase 1